MQLLPEWDSQHNICKDTNMLLRSWDLSSSGAGVIRNEERLIPRSARFIFLNKFNIDFYRVLQSFFYFCFKNGIIILQLLWVIIRLDLAFPQTK